MKLLGGLLLGLLCVFPAKADTIYDVTGTGTMTGNDVCGGPCIETFNFAFQLDESLTQFGYVLDEMPGGTASATGPLGAPTFNDPSGHGVPCDIQCYIPLYFGQHSFPTEFDLTLNLRPQDIPSPTPFVPAFEPYGYLYSCGDSACLADFCDEPAPFTCSTPVITSGSVSTMAMDPPNGPVGTPEPGTAGMLLVGLALMGLCGRNTTLFGLNQKGA